MASNMASVNTGYSTPGTRAARGSKLDSSDNENACCCVRFFPLACSGRSIRFRRLARLRVTGARAEAAPCI